MGPVARLLVAALAAFTISTATTAARAQAGVSVGAANDAEKLKAQELFKGAKMSFDFGRFSDALPKFRASYAIVRSPNTHLSIALCLSELGEKTEAFNEAVGTEAEARAEGERYAETATRAAELRAKLSPEVAVVTVQVSHADTAGAAATVLLGGEDLPRDRWNVPRAMQPGDLEIIGRYHGAEREKKTIHLVVGTPQSVTVDVGAPAAPSGEPLLRPKKTHAEPVEAEGSALLPLAAVAAGVGAGGLTVFAVFGLMNQSTYDALETQCRDRCARADIEEKVADGKTQQTVANIGLVVGGIGVAAAATFLLLEITSDDGPATSNGLTRLELGPTGASVAGRF